MYFGQLLSGLSLIVGFLKNFGIVIVFSWLFQQLKVDKACNAPKLLLDWDGLLLKGKVFWLILFNTENKRRNGNCQDSIFVLLSGLILKTCLCCHHCPKSGFNYLADGYFSEVWRHEHLGLKLNLGMDKPDNDVAVATWQRCCCGYLCPKSGLN